MGRGGVARNSSERKGLDALFFLLALFAFGASGCSGNWSSTLPASTDLGSPRGYRIARTIIHLHTPYSHDACDSKGIVDGVFNESCYTDLRTALCSNRIDYALATDHPDNMASYSMSELALTRTASGDTALSQGGVIGTQIACSGSSHSPVLYVGFESSAMMGTMLLDHYGASASARQTNYATTASIATLQGGTYDSLVFVPHTEDLVTRTIAQIEAAGFNGIEVYNLHANLSPTIRSNNLGLDAFGNIMDLLLYWIDPYAEQQPDLALLSVLEVASVYSSIWNQMVSDGYKPTAIAGSDAHQNVLSFKTRDGERVDSYRRLLRWFSNHVLVSSLSRAELRAALAAGRSWIVFEGLGSPVGMDFYATVSGTKTGVGGTASYVAGATTITVPLPTLHTASPQDGHSPTITIRLRKVGTGGADSVVATSVGASLSYTVTSAGTYRAEVAITSHHLWNYLGYQQSKLLKEYPWIITNPIYLN